MDRVAMLNAEQARALKKAAEASNARAAEAFESLRKALQDGLRANPPMLPKVDR